MVIQRCVSNIAFTFLACAIFTAVHAIDIVDEHKDGAKVTTANGITQVEMPDHSVYAISAIPEEAKDPKIFSVTPAEFSSPKYKAALKGVSLGDEATRGEIVAVLDAYFREVAFDYDSMKLRKLEVGDRQYVAWCSNYMVTCLDWQFRAGTLVDYEINGRNRNGGMTGFEKQILVITKGKGSLVATAPPSIKPTKMVSAKINKPATEVVSVARRVLESQGYKVQNINESTNTLVTTPNVGLLTTKNGDCGRYFGIPNLTDKRAVTNLTIVVTVTSDEIDVGSTVDGVFRTGYGAPDRPLSCTSKGLIEDDLLNQIKVQL